MTSGPKDLSIFVTIKPWVMTLLMDSQKLVIRGEVCLQLQNCEAMILQKKRGWISKLRSLIFLQAYSQSRSLIDGSRMSVLLVH